jgi:hypothetical protein
VILDEAEALLDPVSDIDGFMLACLRQAQTSSSIPRHWPGNRSHVVVAATAAIGRRGWAATDTT